MDLDVINIGALFVVDEFISASCTLSIRDGRVVRIVYRDRQTVEALPGTEVREDVPIVDAAGRVVTPGLVEPHAHPIFAGSRAHEFDLRAQGKSYLEIQQAGGGILSTVRSTRAASVDELQSLTRARLDRFLLHGVTVLEAKTGYDLTPEGELRLLQILASIDHPIDLCPTLLAHVPDGEDSVRQFVAALPRAKNLAEAVDVYCDAGAFTLDETRTILQAARAEGFLLRVHAEQFSHTGAAALAAELGARSVEHLEELADEDVAALAKSGTVCNLLPGAALTLRLKFPSARRLLDAGCRVALGTDCNPGSSLSENLPLMMSLACMQMGMSVDEAWRAVTVEAAHSCNRADAGTLRPGARGDFVLWNAEDPREIVQHYGVNRVDTVAVRGEIVVEGGRLAAR